MPNNKSPFLRPLQKLASLILSLIILSDHAVAEPDYKIYGPINTAQFGSGVAVVGDINNDSFLDYVVSSPYEAGPGSFGRLTAISGKDASTIYEIFGNAINDRFGKTLRKISDLNGDGVNEVLVSANGVSISCPTGSGGTVSYVSVRSGLNGAELFSVSGQRGGMNPATHNVDQIGDINLDGKSDFIVGFPRQFCTSGNPCLSCRGEAKVYSGANGTVLRSYSGAQQADQLGKIVAGIGDIDNDGVGDYALSTQHSVGSQHTRVISGASGLLIYTLPSAFVIRGLGDLNLDGHDDFALGTFTTTAPNTSVKVYSGASGSQLFEVVPPGTNQVIISEISSSFDFTGDGVPEFFVTFNKSISTEPNTVHMVSGSNGTILSTYVSDGSVNFGDILEGNADIDGDGKADLIIADRNASTLGMSFNGFVKLPTPSAYSNISSWFTVIKSYLDN